MLGNRMPRYAIALAILFLAALVILVPLGLVEQWIFAFAVIAAAAIIIRNKGRRATLVLSALAMLVSTRYIVWRTTATLEFDTVPGLILGTGLYLAELYAWLIMALGFLQTSWPLERPVAEPKGEPDEWPVVDVFIPTYNESLEIVKQTVFAAMDMDYPADRFRVFILDDGRRAEFRDFAKEAGCGYLTRSDNLHAKAGNLNAAMKKTDGELIAIFDCDHVPTRAFLQMTIGWFQRDAKLAMLQTPHYFYSLDPVQRNLGTVSDLPGEGELFYGAVQRGNDLWNATFFCGSCALIRRDALEQTNGFAGETVTEDAHTALKLQRMGWNTAYLGVRLSAGLATERLVLHIGQRVRWARGMTQILRIDNPLFGPGLSWQQRLCYLNAMLHFQFPLPRIIFLMAPLAYLLGGQNIIHASAALIFAYALPHLVIAQMTSERTQGGDRRPFWGEIYETILAFHLVKPTVYTWFRPRRGKFNVTDKGDLLDQTYFDARTVRPHLIAVALLFAGITFGFVKYLFLQDLFDVQRGTLILNTAWATFSLIILLAAVSVAWEKRQIREFIRVNTEMPTTFYLEDGHVVEGRSIDISLGGISALLPENVSLAGREVTDISIPMGDEKLTVPVQTVRTENRVARLRFAPLDPLRTRQLVRAVMGRADAWQRPQPYPKVSTGRSFGDVVRINLQTLRRLAGGERKRAAALQAAALVLAGLAGLALVVTPQQAKAQAGPAAAAAAALTPAAGATTGTAGTRRERLTFKDLDVRQPIRLQGTRGEYGIPFGVAANEVVTRARLTLTLAHSPSLLADLSQLVVLLNGEVVDTVGLTAAAGESTSVAIDIEPALFLPGPNQLNLRFLGHYSRDCEDPFHSSLWTNVSNTRSFLDLTIQTLDLPPNLASLPAPFFDTASVLPLRLPFVFAASPTNGELEAAASLSSWFGSLASYRGFRFPVSYGALPTGNAIVLMTPDRRIPGVEAAIDGPSVAVLPNPRDRFGRLLVIMGRNAGELKTAAAAVATAVGLFEGQVASLTGVRLPSYQPYGAPRWLPTDRAVRLAAFTPERSLEGVGLPPGPLTAQFRLAPDLFFWPREGARMDLRYRYPSAEWLDKRSSRLDLSVNDLYLETLPLTSGWWQALWNDGGAVSHTSSARVVLPEYNLFGQNQLTFDYNLILQNEERCESRLPENVRVSILPDSTIDLRGAYHALRMPDLSAFAGGGFPFTVQPDLAATGIVLPDNADPATVEAFLAVMGRFGDSTGAPAIRATILRGMDSERLTAKDLLVIGPATLAGMPGLFERAPVVFEQDRLLVTQRGLIDRVSGFLGMGEDSDTANELLYRTDAFTGMVAFRSPVDSDRSVVALLASNPQSLPGMIYDLEDVDFIAGVQGDLAVVNGAAITSFAVGPTYWVGSLPWWISLGHWFSQHPLLLALGALAFALLIAGPIYLLLRRQQRRRLLETED